MMCLLECQSQLGWRDPTRSRNLYQFPFGGLVCRQSSSAWDFGVWSTLIPTLNPGAGIIECEKLAALSGTRTHALFFHQVSEFKALTTRPFPLPFYLVFIY